VAWSCLLGVIAGCSPASGDHQVFRMTSGQHTATKAQMNFGIPRQFSWAPTDVNPCTLILASEAEAILGPLSQSPHPGGTAIDGTACMYVARTAVVSIGVISTMAYESRKCEPWNVAIEDLGVDAYAVPLYAGDVQLFVRTDQSALMMTLTTERAVPDRTRQRMVTDLAVIALRRLPS
jgi:hypothetical protein